MNVDSVNTTSMSKESMLFCVLHHPSDAEAHNFHLEDPLCLHDSSDQECVHTVLSIHLLKVR